MQQRWHPLTRQVQDLMTGSSLSPDTVCVLLESIDAYFVKNTITTGDSFSEIVEQLYRLDDNNLYSITAVCDASSYQFCLTGTFQRFIDDASKPVIDTIKTGGNYDGESLYREIRSVVTVLKAALEVLRSSVRSTRRATGFVPKKPVLPSDEELKVFYECGRKRAYPTAEEGEARKFSHNVLYLCPHCGKYHQGRPSVETDLPESVRLSRYRTVWRRYMGE